MLMQNKFETSHVYLPAWAAAGDMIDTFFLFYHHHAVASCCIYAVSTVFLRLQVGLLACYLILSPMYSAFASEVDRNTYEHDTLDCNWLAKGGYMRSVSTPATSVYAYTVAFGCIVGYLVLKVCLYRVIPYHGYSQRGSDFIRHLGEILNGVASVRYIPYICVTRWSDYHYKGHSLHFIRCLYRNFCAILSVITALI